MTWHHLWTAVIAGMNILWVDFNVFLSGDVRFLLRIFFGHFLLFIDTSYVVLTNTSGSAKQNVFGVVLFS